MGEQILVAHTAEQVDLAEEEAPGRPVAAITAGKVVLVAAAEQFFRQQVDRLVMVVLVAVAVACHRLAARLAQVAALV